MENLRKLGDLIFPEITETIEDLRKRYPKRELPEGAKVSRYAPSPTGFQHIGSIYAVLVEKTMAEQSGGIFYLRVEDTDQKREVQGAIEDTIKTLEDYGFEYSEGMISSSEEKGNYGPYKQSQRAHLYNVFAKDFILRGLAYPCFCKSEQLNDMRELQKEKKHNPGYYGEYAQCRKLSVEEMMEKINNGEDYILRFRSSGDGENRIEIDDLIKGKISMPANYMDIVMIKSDGLPTYHFAHLVDDYLMGTTDVIRGEEWLSSVPIHYELYEAGVGVQLKYAHIPNIVKMDGDSKRKLSKRKDPESAVAYYSREGYPAECVKEYLMNIANSNFQEWRHDNPYEDMRNFQLKYENMSRSGAIFDLVKLDDVSRDVIARMNPEDMVEKYLMWCREYDEDMYHKAAESDLLLKIFSIDKDGSKPRRDYGKWGEVKEKVDFFYDDMFAETVLDKKLVPGSMDNSQVGELMVRYMKDYDYSLTQSDWFAHMKDFALQNGFASNKKKYTKNPQDYKGMVSDFAGYMRLALSHRLNTPDLYTIMHILGENTVRERMGIFIEEMTK